MLYGNLKKILRLNRTIGLAFCFLALTTWLMQGWSLPLVLWITLTAGYIGVNEIARAALRKFSESENLPLEKTSVFLPVAVFAFTTVSYLLTGQLWVFLFGILPVLQAQLFGHHHLSRGLLLALGIVLLGTLPFGLPHTPTPKGWSPVMMSLPFLLALFHYGAFVAELVRSSNNQVIRLQSLAATDALTGLVNRRQFNHRLHGEIARARRHSSPISLALFDIDDFKKLNDFYGHPVGDRILRELGALVRENIRESDVPARYGGEEFALILPETRQVEAYELLERLRGLIERTVFCLPDNPLTITISVGVAQLDMESHTSFELVEQADAALYEAKKQGKNRVVYGVVPTPKINLHQNYLGRASRPESKLPPGLD